jgi:hypothetical protein
MSPLSTDRQPGRSQSAPDDRPQPITKGLDLSSYEPDILARDLDVIFCGVNPATTAAIAGHNFSSHSNRFWMALHLAGFTDVRLQPHEGRRLLEYRCGLTAIPADETGHRCAAGRIPECLMPRERQGLLFCASGRACPTPRSPTSLSTGRVIAVFSRARTIYQQIVIGETP